MHTTLTDLTRGGVYLIQCLSNGSFYIGQTNCFRTRFAKHLAQLRGGYHHNRLNSQPDHMQKAWNKYGEEVFLFVPVKYCETETSRLFIEQFWFNIL